MGTPQRVEAFKALVAANKERNEARKKLSAANRDKLRTPEQRAANLFDAPPTVSSRHWCGPVIDRNGVRHDGACPPGCPREGHPEVYDYRLEPEVTR
uniref:hypothetical protein n=1 Tax=Gordonia sp. B7-2 TaxID=3420932 RepID=UPI003D94049C